MDDLLVKYLLNECNPEEEAAITAWIQQDAANKKRYDDFVWLWQQSRDISAASKVDVDDAWQRFVAMRDGQLERPQPAPVVKLASTRRRWMAVAAAGILLLTAALLYKMSMPTLSEKPTIVMMEWQATDKPLTDTLPDGSVVTLTKNSTLRFPSAFADSTATLVWMGRHFLMWHPTKRIRLLLLLRMYRCG